MQKLLAVLSIAAISTAAVVSAANANHNVLIEQQHKTAALKDQTTHFHNIYVLGDSLSDDGAFVGAVSDFYKTLATKKWWYGATSLKLGDPYYLNRTFSSGETAVVDLAKKMNISMNAGWRYTAWGTTYEQVGNNYAVGGSQAAPGNDSWWNKNDWKMWALFNKFTLVDQLAALRAQHKLQKDDLVYIESSNNDVMDSIGYDDATVNKMLTAAVGAEKQVIDSLTQDEANTPHIFVTDNVNLALTPEYSTQITDKAKREKTQYLAERNSNLYKNLWDDMMSKEVKQHKGMVKAYSLWAEFDHLLAQESRDNKDTTNATVIRDSSTMSLIDDFVRTGVFAAHYADGKTADNIKDDFFFDTVHPTAWVHQLVANDMYENEIKNWDQIMPN